MPPLVAKGPDLPAELLQAHEEGKVVFFCGAGISLGAGLPTFRGLVDQVYRKLHEDQEGGEKTAYRSADYDRVFELLERRLGEDLKKAKVRPAVREILTAVEDADLTAHKNLLDLAWTRDGALRLITTNFDDLFARAGSRSDCQFRTYEAPVLPVPHTGWRGLVHLHGALNEKSDLADLVLSSSDFGRAYLTEAWASRFLRQLFREYSVVFVGYGVNDPAVRYLMDALVSQRNRGETFMPAWVLAGIRGGQRGETDKQRWQELGVKLILYNQGYHHRHLYRTLGQWASLHRGGLATRASWAVKKVTTPPNSAKEDDARMVYWALSDPKGYAAKRWAESHPTCETGERPSGEEADQAMRWLEVLEERAREDLSGNPTTAERYSKLILQLSSWGDGEGLSKPNRHIARWLSRFLAEDDFLRWLIGKHCVVHRQFAGILRDELRVRSDLEGCRKRFIQTVSSAWYQAALRQTISHERRLDGLDPIIERLEITQLLRVVPRFRLTTDHWTEADPRVSRPVVEPKLEFAVNTWSDSALAMLQSVTSSELAGYARPLTSLLEEATDWLSYLEPERPQAMLLWSEIRSISDHSDVRPGDSWTQLIRLAAESVLALLVEAPAEAQFLLCSWQGNSHPLFRRLLLHVLAESDVLDASMGAKLLLDNQGDLLWETYLRRERERFFRLAGARIEESTLRRLEQAILQGPVDVEVDWNKNPRTLDHLIWRPLFKLKLGGALVSQSALDRLEESEKEYGWQTDDDNRDELLGYSVEYDLDAAVRTLVNMSVAELTALICDEEAWPRIGADWEELSRKRPLRAIRALREATRRRCWPTKAWSWFLDRADLLSTDKPRWLLLRAFSLLRHAHPVLIQDLMHSLTHLMKQVARELPDKWTGAFYEIWDRLWLLTLTRASSLLNPNNSYEEAVSHPSGDLAEALVRRLSGLKPEASSGLPQETRERFERILDGDPETPGRFGQIVLAHNLPYLFFVDKNWTAEYLVPRFKWDVSLGPDFWVAFLHRPRFSPDLLELLQESLLVAMQKRSKLPGKFRERLVTLLATLGIEAQGWISPEQERELVRSLNQEELVELAWHLTRMIEQDPDTAAERWQQAIGPWFERVWPKDRAKRTAKESLALAETIIKSGEAFPNALQDVSPYLGSVSDARIYYLLSKDDGTESGLVEPYAVEILELLSRIVPREGDMRRSSGLYGLDKVLNQIEEVNPSLADDPRFKRLKDLLR